MKNLLLIAASGLLALSANAKATPGSLITDNMVLRQNSYARIYGKADPGARITVTPEWDNKAYTTTTDKTGNWSLAVKTPAGSHTPIRSLSAMESRLS